MKKYPYLILFLLTFALGLPVIWAKLLNSQSIASASGPFDSCAGEIPESSGKDAEEEAGNYSPEPSTEAASAAEPEPEEPVMPQFSEINTDYWDDALFIGDSRMIGLAEYTDLGNAQVFAANGLSTFTVFKKKNSMSTPQEYLKDLLEQNTYGKIYLMLGINELGYQMERLEQQFRTVVDNIRACQPDAILFLCGNMHVTSERSSRDEIYNNDTINRLNEFLKTLAEEEGGYYLDVNEIFDDETGGLCADYTYDDIHIRASHYEAWNEWLRTKGIVTGQ